MLSHRPLVLALSLACAGIAPVLAATAQAQASATRRYDIPAQPLVTALDAYSRLSGVDLVIGRAMPANQSAPALQGDFDDTQALARLLAGSGLRARTLGVDATYLRTAYAHLQVYQAQRAAAG